MFIFIAAFITLLLSIALTRLMLKAPIAIDIPGKRSSHRTITPRGGGIAIVLSWLCFLGMIHFGFAPILSSYMLLLIFVSLVMAAIGFCDDVFQLSYHPRLILQIGVALFMVFNGFTIDKIPLPGIEELSLGPLGPIITIIWVVGFINAFNFMDGLNGLAATGALFVSAILLLFMPFLTPFSFVFYGLIFALLGFLKYNFHRGRIFMSDIGSQFLGCLFATSTLMIEPVTAGELRFYIIPLLFLPFIYDTALTFFYRLLKGKNVFEPHLDHLIHRLHKMGLSHTQVTMLYMIFITGQGVFVYYFLQEPSFLKLGFDFLFYILFSIWVYSRSGTQRLEKKQHATTSC